VLALTAGKQKDLGSLGHFLLGESRASEPAQEEDHAQTDDARPLHG
jgi:hypothetical protein